MDEGRSRGSPVLGGIDQSRLFYYLADWRLVEEHIDTVYAPNSSHTTDRKAQLFWGLRGVDDLVLRRTDNDHNGTYTGSNDRNDWYVTDSRGSVRAVMAAGSPHALVQERVVYQSYGGMPDHTWPGDLDGDGDRDTADGNALAALASANGGAGYPNLPPFFQESSTYDKSGNKLTRFDARPGASWTNRDFQFLYDGLDRLQEAKRGAQSGGSVTVSQGSQQWALDLLGNWATFKTNLNTDNDYLDTGETDTRTHNQANELTARNSGTSISLTYDAAGNMKTHGTRTFIHDAWNRLVKVTQLGASLQTIGEYEYNGLHWRTVKRADTTTGSYNGLDELRVMYYDAGWRMVEEWIDEGYSGSPGWDAVAEQYWGLRYIDDAVMRRIDDDLDDTFRQFMQFTDAQFSFIGSIAFNGVVTDRVSYDACGTARHHRGWDADGDGDIDAADRTLINGLAGISIGHASYKVEADLDRSGTIDATDEGLASGTFAAMPAGWISVGNGCDSPAGYSGYIFNPATNLYTVRFRNYDTVLGKWLERDPVGFLDGMNRYGAFRGNPIALVDPLGLLPEPPTTPIVPGGPPTPYPEPTPPGRGGPAGAYGEVVKWALQFLANRLDARARNAITDDLEAQVQACVDSKGPNGEDGIPIIFPGYADEGTPTLSGSRVECFHDPCAAADRAMDAAMALSDAWEQYEEEQKPKSGWEWWKDNLLWVAERNASHLGKSPERIRYERRLGFYQYFDSLAKEFGEKCKDDEGDCEATPGDGGPSDSE